MKNDLIEFDVAVDECKVIAKSICGHQLRLGEIGANVKTIYGDKTLARLAEASNIPFASFKCYVAVWRAYEGKKLCPSSEFLRHLASPTKGGSGPSVFDIKRPARGAASGDLR